MFDYERYFNQYRNENKLDLKLSFNMPAGYENANGTFDVESKTVFINAEYLKEAPDYEKAFYLFHELRHSSQYLCPELFSSVINRSIQYVIMLEVMPENARLLVLQYTQSLFNARKPASPFIQKTESQILDDLAESRRQIEDGKGIDMKSALEQMGADHGFI